MSKDNPNDNNQKLNNNITLYGSGNTSGSSLEVVSEFQGYIGKLKGMDDDPSTKIPKNQKDSIIEMKDKQLGSLKSQFYFLKEQKKTEFKEFYQEEINKIQEDISKRLDTLNSTLNEQKDKFEEELIDIVSDYVDKKKDLLINEVEGFKLKGDLYQEIQKENFDIKEFVRNKLNHRSSELFEVEFWNKNIPFDDIVEKYFFLNYVHKFKEVLFKVETLEKQFEEALNFNLMITTMKTYQELKKADFFLNAISKMKIEKIDINFFRYFEKEEYDRLCTEVEKVKIYNINPDIK